jgi:Na+-driven multidrug efflux pump
LQHGGGLNGVWVAMGIDFFVQALLSYLRFRQGKWRTVKI